MTATRHRLNESFAWLDRDPSACTTISPAQAAAYDRDGFFVLADAYSPDEVAAIVEAIDPFEEEVQELLRGIEGGRLSIARADAITFSVHLVVRSEVLRRLVASEPLVGLCRDLIGPDVRLYWDQAVYKKPGTDDPFPWHQDNGYAFVVPQQYLTCWIALTDATLDNGCPWVVPGSHRGGTLAHHATDIGLVCFDDAPDAVPVPVSAGSVVVFSSLTAHSTGPNRTADERKAYIVQYAPDGATVLEDGPGGGEPTPAAHHARQFPVLVAGEAVV